MSKLSTQAKLRFRKWDNECSIDESNLSEKTFVEYVYSLEWIDRSNILVECNELGAQWGRKYVTFGSAPHSFYLICCRHGPGRSRVEPNRTDGRDSSTNKLDCSFKLLFGQSNQMVKVDGLWHKYRSWRLTSHHQPVDSNSEISSYQHCHSSHCKPNMRLKLGGILYMYQLTQPMLAAIKLMANSESIRPVDIRTTLQTNFQLNFIDFTLIQNVINIGKPRGQQTAEIDDLLMYFQSKGEAIIYQCQWQKSKHNDQNVLEIRNVFWTTKQMVRLFREYGQLLIVDATYRSNHFNMKLLLFTIRAGNGKFTIVAASLIQHESKDDLRWSFLELMKAADMQVGILPRDTDSPVNQSTADSSNQSNHQSDLTINDPHHANNQPNNQSISQSNHQANLTTNHLHQSNNQPNNQSDSQPNVSEPTNEPTNESINQRDSIVETIMTDGAPAYPSLLQELYPNAVHQLCFWHQQKLMRKLCSDFADDSASAVRDLMDVLRELDLRQCCNVMG